MTYEQDDLIPGGISMIQGAYNRLYDDLLVKVVKMVLNKESLVKEDFKAFGIGLYGGNEYILYQGEIIGKIVFRQSMDEETFAHKMHLDFIPVQ